MTQRTQGDLVDLVYETALEPALWSEVMTRLADTIGGSSGWLTQLSCVDGSGGGADDPSVRLDPVWLQRYADYYAARNPIAVDANPNGYLESWRLITRTIDEEIDREALRRTEFYHDFAAPLDVASSIMIRLARRGAETATLNINCSHAKDRFSGDEVALAAGLQPHLVRAFELGRRLAEARFAAPGPDGLFDASHHGLFLVDREARILRVNPAGEAMLAAADGLAAPCGRLRASSPAADRPLQALIARACVREGRVGGGMNAPTASGVRPIAVGVLPVSPERAWPFHLEPAALVCATDLGARAALPEQQLRHAFGLTAAEARLAVAIAQGLAPGEVAEDLGVSPHTVRNQLARILEKTETHRQAELASLVMRLVGAPSH